MGRQALIVVDMLVDFVDEGGKLYCGPSSRAIIPAVGCRLADARERGVPVIYVCDSHRPDDPEFRMFPTHCVAGTPGAEVVAELAPREGEVIVRKRRFSAFYGTDLDLTLRELGAKELLLVGVCTNICVLYTAADARMRDYDVTVPAGCVATFDEEAHRLALREMEKTLGVRVVA